MPLHKTVYLKNQNFGVYGRKYFWGVAYTVVYYSVGYTQCVLHTANVKICQKFKDVYILVVIFSIVVPIVEFLRRRTGALLLHHQLNRYTAHICSRFIVY